MIQRKSKEIRGMFEQEEIGETFIVVGLLRKDPLKCKRQRLLKEVRLLLQRQRKGLFVLLKLLKEGDRWSAE